MRFILEHLECECKIESKGTLTSNPEWEVVGQLCAESRKWNPDSGLNLD